MRPWIVLLLGAIVLNALVGVVGCSSQPETPPEAAKQGDPSKVGTEAKAEQTQ